MEKACKHTFIPFWPCWLPRYDFVDGERKVRTSKVILRFEDGDEVSCEEYDGEGCDSEEHNDVVKCNDAVKCWYINSNLHRDHLVDGL